MNNLAIFPSQDQTVPCNIEAEESVIGAILLDPEAIEKVKDILLPEAFYVQVYGDIYKEILKQYNQGCAVDLISMSSYFDSNKKLEKIGGTAKLMHLTYTTASSVNVDSYAELIVDKWIRRQAIAKANKLQQLAYTSLLGKTGSKGTSHFLEEIEKEIHELTQSKYRKAERGDMKTWEAQKLGETVREIHLNSTDSVVKYYKKIRLAQEHRISERQLETIYSQYLANRENASIQLLSTFYKQYGNDVNEWFMHGLLPKGSVILLHALGGVGKTRLAYDFFYHLATGTPWNNFHCTASQRRCLIIQTDESPSDTLNALEGRGFHDNMPIYIKTKWTLDHLGRLRKEIEENQIEVVLIDSLTTVNKHSIFSENDTEYARPILELKELAQDLGVTVLVIHHSNSEGRSRGTKAIHNSVSQVLSFKLPSEGSSFKCPSRILCIEKSRVRRPTEYKLRYQVDPDTHQWRWVCEGENLNEPEREATAKDAIMSFLSQQRNTVFEVQEIREKVGGDRRHIGKCCFELAMDGLIGRKKLTKKGTPFGYFLEWEDKTFIEDDSSLGANSFLGFEKNEETREKCPRRDVVTEGDTASSVSGFSKNAFSENKKNILENAKMQKTRPGRAESSSTKDSCPRAKASPGSKNQKPRKKLKMLNGGNKSESSSEKGLGFLGYQNTKTISKNDIQEASPQKIKVTYTGKDPSMRRLCDKVKYLEVVTFHEDGYVEVTAPGWLVTQYILLTELIDKQ